MSGGDSLPAPYCGYKCSKVTGIFVIIDDLVTAGATSEAPAQKPLENDAIAFARA